VIHYQTLNAFALEWEANLKSLTSSHHKYDLSEIPVNVGSILSHHRKLHVSSVTFQENTEISYIHGAFIQWRVPNAFVLRDGVLVGMITRRGLKNAIDRGI
jgi:hypothetical protein